MTARPVLMLLSIAAGCGHAATGGTVPDDEERRPAAEAVRCRADAEAMYGFVDVDDCFSGDARSVAAFVIHSVRAEQAASGYAELWAPDAAGVTFARRASPEPHDLTLSPAQMAVRVAALAEGADPEVEVGFGEAEIRIAGPSAEVTALVRLIWGMGEDSVEEDHRYRLVRVAGAWRIRSLRIRPLFWSVTDDSETYDAAFWDARDRAVEAARARLSGSGPAGELEARRGLRDALMGASRLTEAMEAAREVTSLPGVNANDWLLQHRIAILRGDAGEMRRTEEQARTAPLPPIAGHYRYHYCEADDPEACRFEVVAELAGEPGSELRGVAVVREAPGEPQEVHRLYAGGARGWGPTEEVAVGPFRMSEPVLRELSGAAPPELLARYEATSEEPVSGRTVRIEESGFLVCLGLPAEPRCLRIPERVQRSSPGRSPLQTRAEVTFGDDGTVEIRAQAGRERRIRTGRHRLEDLLPD